VADREDFLSFDNALRELQLNEEQLKRLVSEGEIRAIRGEHNTMRFRREEIDRLKADTGKTIQYTEESSDTLTDDLLFDEADDLEVEDEGMATAQISSEDTFVGDDGDAGEPAPLAPRTETSPGASRGSTGSIRRTTGRSTRMRAATVSRTTSGIGMGVVAMLIVTSLICLYVLPVVWDLANDTLSKPVSGIASFCGEKFGGIKPK
jgi:hypothetical protein